MFGLAFFNPYLLWGLAGAAIPILIHLFNRRRFRTVAWGAMEFLVSSSKLTARRLRILQVLLLLTRMSIVSFLVLGVARPFLAGGLLGGALARSKTSAVIVLDNSYSMGLREGNKSSFDLGREAAKKLVSTFRRGDSLTYLSMAARPRVVTEENPSPERVGRLIENSQLCDETTDVLSSLLKGLEILDSEKNTRKELFLITDCQKNGWGVGNSAGWTRVTQLLAAAKVQPRIFLLDVSRKAGENISVASLRLPPHPIGVGKRCLLEVSGSSSAENPSGRPVFTLFLDGEEKEVGRAEGSEFKNGLSRGRFVLSVPQPGFHWAKIQVSPDCLEADNARYFVIEARRSVPILCVDGVGSDDPFESGIGYLLYAFAPEKGLGVEGVADIANILNPNPVGLEQFWDEDLARYDLVVLSNVRALSVEMYEKLTDFVANGGGLMVFLGDSVDPVEYSERYGSAVKSFLPCAIGHTKGAGERKPNEEPEETYRVSELHSGHPAMASFEGGAGGDLGTTKFYTFFSVQPDTSDPDVDVLATFNDGSPYLVERKFGRGRTILFTSSCDLKWSNLPLKPVFVPLVHRLAYYLVSGADDTYNLTVGDKIVHTTRGAASSAPVEITSPTGERFRMTVGSAPPQPPEGEDEPEPAISFEETSRAGIYALRVPQASVEEPDEETRENVAYFAVNVDRQESDLSVLEKEAIEGLINSKEFKYVKADRKAFDSIERIRHGTEIWRFLLVGVLCFLVLESVLSHQIDKG